jgi:Tol biopolymer transport system component
MDGTLVRTIEPTTGVETINAVVSPDGQRVAYADMKTRSGYWTMRVERLDGTGEATEIELPWPGQAAAFRWSPDGEQLIVSHQYYKETWLFDANGGPGQRATWTDPGSNAWQRVAP